MTNKQFNSKNNNMVKGHSKKWNSNIYLNSILDGETITIYTQFGTKVTGVLEHFDLYNLQIRTEQGKKLLIFKGSIFYIEKYEGSDLE